MPAIDDVKERRSDVKDCVCPGCSSIQKVNPNALSVFCKECGTRITVSARPQSEAAAARSSHVELKCPYCSAACQIPSKALSAFCRSCGRHINLQDYTIKGLFNGNVHTKGTLYVLNSGDVTTNAFVGSAVIEGSLKGSVQADQSVRVLQGAVVKGSLTSKDVFIQDGAALNCIIKSGIFAS